jgi:hypothetical protein
VQLEMSVSDKQLEMSVSVVWEPPAPSEWREWGEVPGSEWFCPEYIEDVLRTMQVSMPP